jgi:hypothetical protein
MECGECGECLRTFYYFICKASDIAGHWSIGGEGGERGLDLGHSLLHQDKHIGNIRTVCYTRINISITSGQSVTLEETN